MQGKEESGTGGAGEHRRGGNSGITAAAPGLARGRDAGHPDAAVHQRAEGRSGGSASAGAGSGFNSSSGGLLGGLSGPAPFDQLTLTNIRAPGGFKASGVQCQAAGGE